MTLILPGAQGRLLTLIQRVDLNARAERTKPCARGLVLILTCGQSDKMFERLVRKA